MKTPDLCQTETQWARFHLPSIIFHLADASACCKNKSPCSILTLLTIALATNIDVVFAIAPFHRSPRSLYPWVHLVDSETKVNVKQAAWKQDSGLFLLRSSSRVQIIRSGNVADCHPACKSHLLICPQHCKTSRVTNSSKRHRCGKAIILIT